MVFFDVFPFLLLLQNICGLHSYGKRHIVKMQVVEKHSGKSKNHNKERNLCIYSMDFYTSQAMRVKNKERKAMRVEGRMSWWKRNTRTIAHVHHTSRCEFYTNIPANRICKLVKYTWNLKITTTKTIIKC